MSEPEEIRIKQIMSGKDRSVSAAIFRAAATCIEPGYAAVMRVRNKLYDGGVLRAHSLGRPTVSVGNITTGGTGKTPVVEWLARGLRSSGGRPAVLMRGYKRTGQGVSDEQKLLSDSGVRVVADPDRVAGAGAALRDEADITAFILDDGMQHRRAGRDFEMVLIHAREPFGYGRIFPRGLLREPLAGLGRADAFLITHASEVDPGAMEKIVATLNRHKQGAGIFRCDHAVSVDLGGRKYFAFCGIGSPESFFASLGGHCVGTRALDDHHDYEGSELVDLARESQAAGAEVLVTTAKDWVKIEPLGLTLPLPVVRAELSLKFHGTDEEQLLGAIRERLTSPSPRHNP